MKFTTKFIGFRSGRLRNKIIASLGYFVFIVGLLGQPSSAPTPWDAFVQMLLWTLLFLFILIPTANLFSIRKKLFFFNRLSLFGKVFGVIGYALIALIVCATIGAGLKSVTAKQIEAKQQAAQQITTKVATDSKVKADEEARVKAEAQAKAKAQQEAKLKAEADAKARAIANANAQATEAAEKKKEADAAESKAEQQAKAQAAAQAIADPQAQTFQNQTAVAATPAPPQQQHSNRTDFRRIRSSTSKQYGNFNCKSDTWCYCLHCGPL